MKRNRTLGFLLVILFLGATGLTEARQVAPGQGGQRGLSISDPLALLSLLGQRGVAGQRGGAPATDQTGRVVRRAAIPQTAWWTDTRLVAQLGLSEDQKRRIENTFEAYRQNLSSATDELEREEAQLATLLEAESIDRSEVSRQINRVIQARGDMERTNATMMLEMREHLTRAQWTQLQNSQGMVLTLRTARIAGQDLLNPTPNAVSGETPSRVGANVAQKNLVSSVDPTYPPLAKAARIEGNVLLQVVISKEGAVTDIKVVSGHPLLNDAAMDAVRQWRYKPVLLNGQPISVITTVTLKFANP